MNEEKNNNKDEEYEYEEEDERVDKSEEHEKRNKVEEFEKVLAGWEKGWLYEKDEEKLLEMRLNLLKTKLCATKNKIELFGSKWVFAPFAKTFQQNANVLKLSSKMLIF